VSGLKPASALAIVAATGIGLALGISVLGMATFGVFIVPLSNSFRWGEGTFHFPTPLCVTRVAILSPLVGYLIDRYGVRRTLLPSIGAIRPFSNRFVFSECELVGLLWGIFRSSGDRRGHRAAQLLPRGGFVVSKAARFGARRVAGRRRHWHGAHADIAADSDKPLRMAAGVSLRCRARARDFLAAGLAFRARACGARQRGSDRFTPQRLYASAGT